MNRLFNFRSQIKQTLKKKAFEEAGIPVKQVLVQAQPSTSTQVPQETIYVKNEPQILSAIPSTSTAIIVTQPEPPSELLVPTVKCGEIQIDTNEDVNLLTNPNVTLLSTPSGSIDDSIDSNELKLDDIVTG